MLRIYYIIILILSYDLCESIAQPLAPRNRTKRRPVLETFVGGGCNFCVDAEYYILGVAGMSCPFTRINYHAGYYAIPKDSTSPDLRTDCGTRIHDSLRITGYPTAYIDRIDGPLNYKMWSAINYPEFNGYASINIGLQTLYHSNQNETEITVELYPFKEYKDSFCYLTVLVIEDNVVAPQLLSANNWNDKYSHAKVFRENITSCFGDKIDSLITEVPIQRHYTYKVPNTIKAQDSYVVAFVSDTNGFIITSEVQPLRGGRTNVFGFLDSEADVEVLLDKNDSISQIVKFTSYEYDSMEYCFVISRDIPEWEASITIDGLKSNDTIRKWMRFGQTIDVNIDLAPISIRAYGKLFFQVLPYCIKDSCHTVYNKTFTIQPGSEVLIIYNTALNRDGTKNKMDLWKPFTDVLETFNCDNFIVIKDQLFEPIYNFRRKNHIKTTAIYYAAGWGQPILKDSMVEHLDTLIKSGTNLFIAGQDVAYSLAANHSWNPFKNISWFNKTLGAFYLKDGDTSLNEVMVDDRDPIFGQFGHSKILPIYQNGNALNIMPDVISIDPINNRRFLYNNKGTALGCYRNAGIGKVVLICVGMEMLEDKELVSKIIVATHNWFDGCPTIVHTESGNKKPSNTDNIEVKWINHTLVINLPDKPNEYQLKLVNIEGRSMVETKLVDHTNTAEVNVPNLKSGVYYYLISDTNKRTFYRGKCLVIE